MSKNFKYVITDTETNGLEPETCEVIEVAYMTLNADTFEVEETWSSFVKPSFTVMDNTDIHGITAEMVADAPEFDEISDFLAKKFNGNKLVAHNGRRFDKNFFIQSFERSGLEVKAMSMVDTLDLSRKFVQHVLGVW